MQTKIAVMTFGRFTPMTTGHEKLINSVIKKANIENADPYVFTSQTFDGKKNPLKYEQKIYWLKKAFHPRATIVRNKNIGNPFDAIDWLITKKKYTHIYFVVGGDRIDEFTSRIEKWATKEYPEVSFFVFSAGKRAAVKIGKDDVSGSLLRRFASQNEFDKFKLGVPKSLSGQDALNMFYDVRVGMGLKKNESTSVCKYATDCMIAEHTAADHLDEYVENSQESRLSNFSLPKYKGRDTNFAKSLLFLKSFI